MIANENIENKAVAFIFIEVYLNTYCSKKTYLALR